MGEPVARAGEPQTDAHASRAVPVPIILRALGGRFRGYGHSWYTK